MYVFCRQKTAYGIGLSLLGSEMCIRDGHRDVVLYRATLRTSMFSQGPPMTRATRTRAPSVQEATRTPPAKRQTIALLGSPPVAARMFRQPRRGAASAIQADRSCRSRNWIQREGIWNICSANSSDHCEASNLRLHGRTGTCVLTKCR